MTSGWIRKLIDKFQQEISERETLLTTREKKGQGIMAEVTKHCL